VSRAALTASWASTAWACDAPGRCTQRATLAIAQQHRVACRPCHGGKSSALVATSMRGRQHSEARHACRPADRVATATAAIKPHLVRSHREEGCCPLLGLCVTCGHDPRSLTSSQTAIQASIVFMSAIKELKHIKLAGCGAVWPEEWAGQPRNVQLGVPAVTPAAADKRLPCPGRACGRRLLRHGAADHAMVRSC
jgi:hypothetical protein